VAFDAEKVLHHLVAEAPELLPRSDCPRLTILGREVGLGGGCADLVAVDPMGTLGQMRSFSDIPNRYTHILLQEAGAVYDEARGLPPIRRLTKRTGTSDAAVAYNRQVETVLAFFGGACAYCGAPRVDDDHLTPRNRVSGGLHAWGNVVPACKSCNSAKSNRLWTDHLAVLQSAELITSDEADQSAEAIRAMVAHFDYKPQVNELLPVVEDLYRHADVQARSLLKFAVSALRPYLDTIADRPHATTPHDDGAATGLELGIGSREATPRPASGQR
jgi:hypothetical protein